MKTIFVVDDTDSSLFLTEKALEEYYRILTMPSAVKMFTLLEKIMPDLILLDVDMPEINGCEAIKILKSKPETKDIPVILFSSNTGYDDKLEWLSLGAIDYITKPFQPPLLLKRLEVHLPMAAQWRENTFLTDTMSYNRIPAQAEISTNQGNNEVY